MMKSNRLFMAILLGGMLSSGLSFGMEYQPKEEPTRIEKLADWLYKHKNKAALMALLAPAIYTAMTTSQPEWGQGFSTFPPAHLALIVPWLAPFAAKEKIESIVKENPINALSLIAGTAFGTYMYISSSLSSSEKGWLARPELAGKTKLEQITILEEIQKNMSWPRYLAGGAIGLSGAITYLKTQLVEEIIQKSKYEK